MNFQVPILGGVITFAVVFLLNLVNKNSFGMVVIRSLLAGGLIFGIGLGVVYILKDLLKIDFSGKEENSDDNSIEENKVDISVDDEITENSGVEDDTVENSFEKYSDEDMVFSDQSNTSDENKDDNDEDMGFGASPFNGDRSMDNSLKDGKSIKDILGYEASPEELAKAIKTKITKDE